MAQELQNFIGGQWTDTSFDKRAELVDPSTGEVFATAPVSSETEVDAAVPEVVQHTRPAKDGGEQHAEEAGDEHVEGNGDVGERGTDRGDEHGGSS